MSALEKLKEKLRAKPNVELDIKQVEVVIPLIPGANKLEEVKLANVTIRDKRETSGFNMADLTKKLKDRKLTKLIVSPLVEKETELEVETLVLPPKKKSKKLTGKSLLVLQEEGVSILPGETAPIEAEELGPEGLEETVVLKKKPRKSSKLPKGVAILPPEAWVQFGDTSLIERLPEKQAKVNYKVSSYYMNNREIFVNFINSIFEPYRDQVLDDSSQVSCEDLSKDSGEFKLLTHQKLVRDYLNLYTPYRGLLLYHSLGSGKTASSIAIAEGMKGAKRVIVMTPASLEDNYRLELKNAGDPLYRLNQCWEWVSIKKNPEAEETLSSILSLPLEYIRLKGGAWLVNATKPSNCNEDKTKSPAQLQQDQVSLNEQIDKMIETKYQFIHYNGLRRDKLRKMTNNFETNFFDDSVIIIDEAHNLISRIVNKIGKEKEISMDKTGKREKVNISIALILYEMLLTAQNARIVLLTGTPIINYPNEIGILFNILRGYIKTWEIPLDLKGSQTVNKEVLQGIFTREKVMDYMDYSSSSKQLTVTRNPFGFENKEKKGSGYHGVTNEKKTRKGDRGEIILQERGIISDADFERRIIHILRDNGIEVFPTGIRVHMYKALPDRFEEFSNWFIESGTMNIKNSDLFKRRIMGLTSYFRSAQESLLPAYEKVADYHIVKIPMSNFQFGVYEAARQQERKQETSSKKKKGKVDENGIFQEPTSTYRIFSRLYCNFVMPKAVGRPLPKEDREVKGEESGQAQAKVEAEAEDAEEIGGLDKLYEEVLQNADKVQKEDDEREDELEGDEIIDKFADSTYEKRLKTAMEKLKRGASQYLSHEGLETYSPKYLNILENIQDPEKIGLHLVYSQFRTLEGIGIFKLVLEENGFSQFKLKKDPAGVWQIDIAEEDRGKPTFALYTGTETKEEKELVRKVYNGLWNELPPSLSSELKEIAHNNNTGEIIKVFMITASGSEGINLRNTRYVHIMEPYWHPVRSEQVIGRARRICSHKELPQALQTVEVYVYLMTFTKEQLLSDASIELKLKDLSKKEYNLTPEAEKQKLVKIPFTSDEALFEISTIKEEVSNQLIKSVKESSIDCAIYSRVGNKEQLHCLQFADATANAFSFNPSLKRDEPDSMAQVNKEPLQWTGKEITLLGKVYIYRRMDKTRGNIYDLESYKQALATPGIDPILIGTLEKEPNGELKFKKI
jgi:hypothetical protein